jgi:predicted RNA methylase
MEPFSLVTRQGLDRVLTELRLAPGDHLVDLCCGRGGIGLWFASVSGARLTGVDFSPGAIAQASRRAACPRHVIGRPRLPGLRLSAKAQPAASIAGRVVMANPIVRTNPVLYR